MFGISTNDYSSSAFLLMCVCVYVSERENELLNCQVVCFSYLFIYSEAYKIESDLSAKQHQLTFSS